MDLLSEIPRYELAYRLLVLHDLLLDHRLFLDGQISDLNLGKALVVGALGETST